MNLDPVALAVPFFFVAIFFEVRAARKRDLKLYRFADAITDLSCGTTSELVRLFLNVLALAAYAWVYRSFSLVHPPVWAQWVIALIGLDFFYYWFHRLSHEVNSLWAMHVVHHQSQDYNLAVALRQSWFQGFAATPFYFPLALLGVSPEVFVLNAAVSLLYQFGLHTQVIEKLPRWFEAVFNTPSHHRVHHGINPEYIDRNHAGIFIVWDKMFGTFEPEGKPPVYGTVKVFESWNPVWANFEYWKEIRERMKRVPRLWQKAWVWLANPAWLPRELGGWQQAPPVDARNFAKWEPAFPDAFKPYVNFQFVLVAAMAGVVFNFHHRFPWSALAVIVVLGTFTTATWGGLFEGKSWARPAEWARHGFLLLLGVYLLIASTVAPVWVLAGLLVVAASGFWFWKITGKRDFKTSRG